MIADSNTCVYTVYNGNWYGVGGTSVSAPLFAGILSLANQMRFNSGKNALTTVYSATPNAATTASYVPPANNVQTYLYKKIYTNPTQYSSIFNDITLGYGAGSIAGSAAGSMDLSIYNAGINFDVSTGLGSPNANNLCNSLLNI